MERLGQQKKSGDYGPGKTWIDEIKDEGKACPMFLKIAFDSKGKRLCQNPDPTKFKDPTKAMQAFHPGAVYDMRSLPTKHGHGNQCTYDACCKLVQSIPAAGSADYAYGAWDNVVAHGTHDVDPYSLIDKTAPDKQGKNLEKHYEVRPQVNAGWQD